MADRRGARGGPSRTPATTPASCPPYLELRSRCLGSRRWRFDGSGFLRACVRKLRDIFAGRAADGWTAADRPRPPQHGKSTCARTHKCIHHHSTMQSGPSTLVRCRNKFGKISKRKTSFPFPFAGSGAPRLAGTGSSGRAKRPTWGDGKAAEDGEGGGPRGVREASGEAGEGPVEGA